jgi:molybdopterin converting factor small subunit
VLIQVQYFAQLRGLGGPDSIELAEGTTVEGLLKNLYRQAPGLEAWNRHILIAAGIEWVDRAYIVQPGDLISLMPPVQGG